MRKNTVVGIVLTSILLVGCGETSAVPSVKDPAERLLSIADAVEDLVIKQSPIEAYYGNLDIKDHSQFSSNKPREIEVNQETEDALLQRLKDINSNNLPDAAHKVLHAQLLERLEANQGLRVCKKHLWDVNHMFGSHSILNSLADFQPTDTTSDREQALKRWSKVAGYYNQEIVNLKTGLNAGYTMPAAVVERVIGTVRALVEIPANVSPLMGPANRSEDPDFKTAYRALVSDEILPAMWAWVNFLENEYLPVTRTDRAITSIPNGEACYQAMYRSYTSMNWSPERVHETGTVVVERQTQDVIEFGKTLYGLDNFEAIIDHSKKNAVGFTSAQAMTAFYEAVNARAIEAVGAAFSSLPASPLVIIPIEKHEQGQGLSAHYNAGDTERPGEFRFDPTTFNTETQAGAEIVTVHEGYPGHHLQISLAYEQASNIHPVQRILDISAFAEGWARYSEHLAEELGVYTVDNTRISRRAWPARGMVSDTGMHVLGWDSDKTLKYLQESGNFGDEEGIAMIDRMAAIPAQLTSYDSGAQEIFALRALAEQKLGDQFDLKTFHHHLLKNGNVPLWLLREQIEVWIKQVQL